LPSEVDNPGAQDGNGGKTEGNNGSTTGNTDTNSPKNNDGQQTGGEQSNIATP
jgi:hypothetical protein